MINIDYPEIVFEDNHVLVAVKSAGVLSQSDGTDAPDMLTQLKAYLKDKYNKPGDAYLGLLHRLDRNVSGLMVFAKTSKCASRLSEQIRSGRVRKGY
ncbi:MAG: pseudouridine synthase, partial [Saccharofermentanaceae bacterium]